MGHGGIVDGAGADDDEEAVAAAEDNVGGFIAASENGLGGVVGQGNLGRQEGRRDKGILAED